MKASSCNEVVVTQSHEKPKKRHINIGTHT